MYKRQINGHPEISDKTKKRVLRAVEDLGYIPNRYAQQLVGYGVLTIGFTIPDINDSFFAKCAVGAEEIICQRGHDIAYHSIQRSTDRLCEFLIRAKEFRYNSVIITPEYWEDSLFPVSYTHLGYAGAGNGLAEAALQASQQPVSYTHLHV